MNPNHKQRMRATLYSLKRNYGGRIVIHKHGVTQVDAKTGLRVVQSTEIPIRRAIVLPAEAVREEVRGISLISANKGLVQGGWYDTDRQVFIVDHRDAPTLELTLDDWIVFKGIKHEVELFRNFELDACWVINTKALLGEVPPQSRAVSADNSVTLTQESASET